MAKIPRIIIDTNVLFSAIGWGGVPRQILDSALSRQITILLTPYIIEETRAKLSQKLPAYLPTFHLYLRFGKYEPIPDPSLTELRANRTLIARDPDDVLIALAAIKAQVDYLVTGDKDFHDPANTELHEAVTVITPRQFVDQVLADIP